MLIGVARHTRRVTRQRVPHVGQVRNFPQCAFLTPGFVGCFYGGCGIFRRWVVQPVVFAGTGAA